MIRWGNPPKSHLMSDALSRCSLLPLPDHQVAWHIDGKERLRWHFGPAYPRPFFYPLLGPSGESLTRIGHPGAPDHDHHRSLWFAHASVNGLDFWSENGPGRIRQRKWYCYEDGDDEARMAVALEWQDGTGTVLLEQELITGVRPLPRGELIIELQSRFRPIADAVVVDQSNFGILAIRMAKSLSGHFGGGTITSSEGEVGERSIFGQYARWMDYSGPVRREETETRWNGVTYLDHPENPGYPAHWHVREDGWMGASLTRLEPLSVTAEKGLVCRYLLHVHDGKLDVEAAESLAGQFALLLPYQLEKSSKAHTAWSVRRLSP